MGIGPAGPIESRARCSSRSTSRLGCDWWRRGAILSVERDAGERHESQLDHRRLRHDPVGTERAYEGEPNGGRQAGTTLWQGSHLHHRTANSCGAFVPEVERGTPRIQTSGGGGQRDSPTGGGSLMDAREERRLIRAAKRGDRDAMGLLVESLQPQIYNAIKRRYGRLPQWTDDLRQDCAIAVMLAVRRFEPSRKFRLGSYAAQRIFGAILDWERGQSPKGAGEASTRAGIGGQRYRSTTTRKGTEAPGNSTTRRRTNSRRWTTGIISIACCSTSTRPVGEEALTPQCDRSDMDRRFRLLAKRPRPRRRLACP